MKTLSTKEIKKILQGDVKARFYIGKELYQEFVRDKIYEVFDELKLKMSYRYTPVYKDTNSSEPLWEIRDKDFNEIRDRFTSSLMSDNDKKRDKA